MLPGAVVPPSEDHSYAQYRYRDDGPSDQPSPFKKLNMTPKKPSEIEEEEVGDSAVDAATGDDLRKCLFCQNFGDDNPDVRLNFLLFRFVLRKRKFLKLHAISYAVVTGTIRWLNNTVNFQTKEVSYNNTRKNTSLVNVDRNIIGLTFAQDCGRLLYAGQDDWVHVNCALWSAEVYEEVDGTLQNVHAAVVRGKQLVSNLRFMFTD